MLTAEQLVYAAAQPPTLNEVSQALDIFLSAAFTDIQKLTGVTPATEQTPINNGMIAMTYKLHMLGWAQASIPVMGIRVYRSMLHLLEGMPETALLVRDGPMAGVISLSDDFVNLVAKAHLSFDLEKGVVVFPDDDFKAEMATLINEQKKLYAKRLTQ